MYYLHSKEIALNREWHPGGNQKWDKANVKRAEEECVQKLTVKRLFLTRGELKASSRTSALMSGFAMVSVLMLLIF